MLLKEHILLHRIFNVKITFQITGVFYTFKILILRRAPQASLMRVKGARSEEPLA